MKIQDDYLILREYFKDNEDPDECSLNSDISEWFHYHKMRPTFILNLNIPNFTCGEGSFSEIFGPYIRKYDIKHVKEVDMISMKNSLIEESWGDPIIGFTNKEEALLFKMTWQ